MGAKETSHGMVEMAEFSAADVRLWDRLAEKRDRKGAEWCKKHGFGAERRSLERAQPFDVISLAGYNEAERDIARVREAHRLRLMTICRACKRCEFGWLDTVTIPPASSA